MTTRWAPVLRRGLLLALAATLATAACVAVLKFGGSIRAAKLDAFGIDVGSTPWLLPVARMSMELAAAVTVGCLIAAAFFVPGVPGVRLRVGAAARGWLRGAAVSALVWAAAAVATMALTLSDLLAVPVSEAVNAGSLTMLATTLDAGRGLATVLALASVIAVAVWFVRSVTGVAVVAVIAVVATLPPAFAGHAAGASNHQLAVSTMILHILGAVLWTGGLVALLLTRRQPGPALARAVGRFSRLALCCFGAVLVTGVASAALRLSTWSDFNSGYGVVLLLKIAALTGLGGFGWWHRRMSIPALAAGRRGTFARVAAAEVLVMATAIGLAAGLARTQPPDDPHAAALIRTPIRAVLNWLPDPLFLTVAVAAVACYLIGVRRLRMAWPVARTVAWIAGWLVVAAATNLQLARAGDHMFLLAEKLQHLAIGIVAPILLVSGGGIALALHTLAPATEPGMRGPREWLATALDSRATRVLSHPAATLALYAATLHGLYASALYTLSLRSHAGHLVTFAAALAISGLFYWPLLGVHAPARAVPHTTRMAQLLAATLLQAVMGIALAHTTPLADHSIVWVAASTLLVGAVWAVYRTDSDDEPTAVEELAAEIKEPVGV